MTRCPQAGPYAIIKKLSFACRQVQAAFLSSAAFFSVPAALPSRYGMGNIHIQGSKYVDYA